MATKRKSNDDTENSKEGVRRSTRIKKSVPLEEPLDADVQQKGSGQGRSRKTKAKDPNESNEASMKRRKTSQPNAKSTKAKPAATNSSSVSKDIVEDAKGSSGGDTIRTGHSYWLMKAEPDSRMEKGVDVKFSIDDLEACTEPEPWTGVRNHVAKNNMIAMKKGDLAFFYHSNTKLPGIAGILEIVHESSVDESAFDSKHPYYDPKSDREKPRWFHVHVGFQQKFPCFISLKELQSFKGPGQALENMQLHKQSRLSVSKVSKKEWDFILGLVEEKKETSE